MCCISPRLPLSLHVRYANMDYVILSASQSDDPRLPRYRSYDIACKYSVHFRTRVQAMPPSLQFDLTQAKEFYAIPKYHISGHDSKCHTLFGFDYMLGAGRTSGEGVEPIWIPANALALSVQEMTPSCREETLDDNFHHSNFQKIISWGIFTYYVFLSWVVADVLHH